MPALGQNVGSAYVRIFADGSGMDDEIRRGLRDAEPGINDEARRGSDRYSREFNRGIRKNFKREFGKTHAELMNDLNDGLTNAIVRQDYSKRFFNNPRWKAFRKRLEKEGGDAGLVFGDQLERHFRDSGALDHMGDDVEHNFGTRVRRAQKELLDNLHGDALRMNREFNRKDERDRKFHMDRIAAFAENERRDNNDRVRQYKVLTEQIDRMTRGEKQQGVTRGHLLDDLYRLRLAAKNAGPEFEGMRNRLRDQNRELALLDPNLRRAERRVGTFADSMSRGFGRGSRNNFFNFIGKVSQGLLKLPIKVLHAAGSFGRLRRSMQLAAGETFLRTGSRLAAAMAGLGEGAMQVGKLFLKLGGSIAAAFIFVGPLAALLSLLGGVVLALSSTIAFALAGALGGLAAIAFPAAAALGVLAYAFAGLTREQKKALRVDFKPVVTQLKKLREAARDGIFSKMNAAAKALRSPVKSLTPLFRGMGKAIGDVVIHLADATKSDAFAKFVKSMGTFLPDATRKLGTAITSALGGVGGLFRGMIPFMTQVLDWLVRITAEFSVWANSAKGQNEIARFFDRSMRSMKSFADFLGSVGGLLSAVFRQGRQTGDEIFGSITRSIDGLTAKLNANPDIMRGYFKSVKHFATELGSVISGLGDFFGALDNAGTRTAVIDIFKALGSSLKLIGEFLDTIGPGAAQGLIITGGALLIIGKSLKALAGLRGIGVALGLLGPEGAAAGAGLGAAGAGAGEAAIGFEALLGLPLAAAAIGGFAAYMVGKLDAVNVSIADTSDALSHFAATGKTTGTALDQSSHIFGSSIALIDDLTFHTLDLSDGMSSFGNTMERVAKADSLDKVFNQGAIKQIGQVDTGLTHMSKTKAAAAFAAITKEAKAQGLSIEQINKLFPKYTSSLNQVGGVMTHVFKQVRNVILAAVDPAQQLAQRFKALPKGVQIAVKTPGMVESIGDVKTLKKLYDLTPKQVVTTLAAAGIGDTISEVKEVRKQMDLTPKQVFTLIKLNGKVKSLADLNVYAKALNLTPKQRTTLMKVLGIKEAVPTITELNKQLKGVPKSVVTKIIAQGADVTKSDLDKIVISSGKLNGKQIKAIFKAEGFDIGQTHLETLLKLAKIANNRKIKMKADLDTSKFDAARRRTMAAIAELAARKPKPKADLDTGKFAAARRKAMADVTDLDHKRAKPKVDLDHGKFDAGKARVGTGIADMGRKIAKPKADLDHSQFDAGRARVGTEMSSADRLSAHPKITVTADTSGAGAARDAINSIQGKTVFINIQRRLYGPSGGGPANPGASATGGVFGGMANYAQTRMIGEAGPEAVVPLMRPLSQVDPAVRWLSAIAQGKLPGMAAGGVVGSGRTVNIGEVNVITPNTDTRAVAHEVVNKLVAVGY